MSYCVNCGVELDSSAVRCVLCGTEVYNPQRKEEQGKVIHPFSEHIHLPEELSPYGRKKLVIAIVTMVMLIPDLVCVVLNLTLFKETPWSLGVIAGTLFGWSAFVLPFATKRPRPYVIWAADSLIACINALVFVWLYADMKLFARCLLPVIISCSLCVLFYMLWYRKDRHIIMKLAFVFFAFSLMCLSVGIIFDISGVSLVGIEVGIICFVSFLAIFGFFLYCYSSKTIRKWAAKKFFL